MRKHKLAMLGTVIAAFAAVPLIFGGSAAARDLERPSNQSSPTISGTPQEGATLTATTGSWKCTPGPCTYEYQWQRCNANGVDCGPISGSRAQTYVPGPQDVGFRLQVSVSATNIDCNEPGTVCAPSTGSAVSPLTAIITIKPGVAPAVTGPPTISGTPQQGETLTATLGSFSGEQPLTMGIEWARCDRAGNSCAAIFGANTARYAVTNVDVGNTLRVYVTARNRGGTASATSAPTAVVRPESPSASKRSIGIAEVELPYRLVIDQFQVPRVVRSRAPFTVRIHISEARGFWVSGALVSVMAVPPNQVGRTSESRTRADGWATFVLRPNAALQLRAGGALYLFVQTRKPGESALTGVSASRLIKVRLAAG